THDSNRDDREDAKAPRRFVRAKLMAPSRKRDFTKAVGNNQSQFHHLSSSPYMFVALQEQ
ncbi:hypothetical protein SK128_018092, partial [Halocaridina rubra]